MSVAVVSYQSAEVLEPCLESVIAARPVETVVIDNGSTDGSIEMVRDRFPSVTLIVNSSNRGYGAAANQAIAASTAPATLLLNSDTVLAADALAALGRYLGQHPRAALVGPRLANPDGTLQPSTFPYPSVGDLLLGNSGLQAVVRRVPFLRELFLRTWSQDAARRVPWVRGAALAIRRAPFEAVGGFDEGYFMYWEEVDLCRRLEAAGFETHYAPVTTVLHAQAVSTGKQRLAMHREWLVSFRRYLRNHESPRSAATLLRLLRVVARVRVARVRLQVLLSPDAERRARARSSAASWKALLAEEGLWRP